MKRRATLAAVLTLTMVTGSHLAASATESQNGPGGRAVQRISIERANQRVHSSDAAAVTDAQWALRRFALAALDLPAVDIYFHSSLADCSGNLGLRTTRYGKERVDVCTQARRVETLLHELAHVWAAHALPESTKDDFLEWRGLEVWNDKSARWGKRGSEHAAEVVAWGVGDSRRLPGLFWDEHAAVTTAFKLLTGRDPLNPS